MLDIHTAVQEVGSPTALALMLKLDRRRGGQRVSQWLHRRKIPPQVQLDYAHVWRKIAARIARRAKRQANAS